MTGADLATADLAAADDRSAALPDRPLEQAWRLLDTGFQPAAVNMAIDEAILEAHGAGDVPPTLRFYGWNPPAVSIGYFQRLQAEVDLDACRRLGVDAVRRPTGGRAVLHEDELTYSVVIRQGLLPGDVIHTYRVLCQGLLDGIRRLDVPVEMAAPHPGRPARLEAQSSAACFNSPSWYELEVRGRKVVGSAQVRTNGVILQHGSILLSLDADRLFTALRLPDEKREAAKRVFLRKATSLGDALGERVPWEAARDAVTAGFAAGLGLSLIPGELTPGERARAEELVRTKYGADEWNAKK